MKNACKIGTPLPFLPPTRKSSEPWRIIKNNNHWDSKLLALLLWMWVLLRGLLSHYRSTAAPRLRPLISNRRTAGRQPSPTTKKFVASSSSCSVANSSCRSLFQLLPRFVIQYTTTVYVHRSLKNSLAGLLASERPFAALASSRGGTRRRSL